MNSISFSIREFYERHRFAILSLLAYSITWFLLTLPWTMSSDASDHWVWSRKIFPSYLEHPPMIAVYLRFFNTLIPSPVLSLKIASILTSALTYFFLYLGVYRFQDSKTLSKNYLLCIFSSPYLVVIGTHISITPLMTLFCAISFALMAEFYTKRNPNYLLWMGISLGFAMLSKYLAIFYYVAFYGWILFEPRMRIYFRAWQIYVFPLISLVIFSPVLYANFTQDFLFFSYQLNRGLGEQFGWNWPNLMEFWIGNLMYGPIFVIILIGVFFTKRFRGEFRKQEPLFWFWIFSFFPSFLFFSYSVLKGGFLDPQWLNLNYFAGLFLLCRFFQHYFRPERIKKLFAISLTLSFLLTGLVWAHLNFRVLGAWQPAIQDKSMDFIAWEKSGRQLEKLFKEKGEIPDIVIVREYSFGGLISLYMPSHPFPYSLEKSQRNFWVKPEELKNKKVGFVCIPTKCAEYFERIEKMTGKQLIKLGQTETFHPFTGEKIRTLIAYSTVR